MIWPVRIVLITLIPSSDKAQIFRNAFLLDGAGQPKVVTILRSQFIRLHSSNALTSEMCQNND